MVEFSNSTVLGHGQNKEIHTGIFNSSALQAWNWTADIPAVARDISLYRTPALRCFTRSTSSGSPLLVQKLGSGNLRTASYGGVFVFSFPNAVVFLPKQGLLRHGDHYFVADVPVARSTTPLQIHRRIRKGLFACPGAFLYEHPATLQLVSTF